MMTALDAFKAAFETKGAPVKPTICLDIDGVLAFLLESILAAVNAHFGTDYLPSEQRNYWLESYLPKAQAAWATEQFATPMFYQNLAPDFGGIAAANALHRSGFAVWIVTDRPASAESVTKDWLGRWRVPYDKLVLGLKSKRRTAAGASPEAPLVFVDDDPRKAAQLPREGVTLYMPRRPWTPRGGVPRATVFDTWDRVLSAFGVTPELADVPQLMRRPTK